MAGEPPIHVTYHVEHLHTNQTNIHSSYVHTVTQTNQAGNDQGVAVPGPDVEGDEYRPTSVESDSLLQPQPHFPPEEGWVRPSDKIVMNNKQPIRKGSSVYKGKQKHAGAWRDVAIKLVRYEEKNFNEVKLLLKLDNHQNVIRFYDSDVTHDGLTPHIYIVMEQCPQNLKDYIEGNKNIPFDFDTSFSYAKQIVTGVAFIHSNSVLHRDLKLENILLAPDTEHIRVTDFGLSKQIDEGLSIDPVSSPGLGTDGYRAPELHNDAPEASFYSDTFSLGILLFALFSNGAHPFGKEKYKWRSNIIDNKRRDFSSILRFDSPHGHKREQLIDLLKCALKHKPRDRPKPQDLLKHAFFTDSTSETSRGQSLISKFTSIFTSTPNTETTTPSLDSISDGIEETSLTTTEGIQKLEELLATSSLTKIGYRQAVNMLHEVRKMRGSLSLDQTLQLAECELYLQPEQKKKILGDVMHMCKHHTPEELKEKAEAFKESGHATRALILYTMTDVSTTGEEPPSPDDAVRRIYDHVITIRRVMRPLLESLGRHRDIAINCGLTHIVDLLHKLRAVKRATPTVKVPHEAMCLVQIASINGQVGDTKNSLQVCEEGLNLLENQLGELKEKYKCYSWLLNNMSAAFHDSGQHEAAIKCVEKCKKSIAKASDYDNEAEKKDLLEIASRNLTRYQLSL